jgi:hypothetical protein
MLLNRVRNPTSQPSGLDLLKMKWIQGAWRKPGVMAFRYDAQLPISAPEPRRHFPERPVQGQVECAQTSVVEAVVGDQGE